MVIVYDTSCNCALEVYEVLTNSFNTFNLQSGQKCIKLCYKGKHLKIKHAGVMVLVLDTSSECALQNLLYEVSLKYL